jgi:hypothetical protein
MDELDRGAGREFLEGVAEGGLPRRIEELEIAVRALHAQQIQREVEQPIALVGALRPISRVALHPALADPLATDQACVYTRVIGHPASASEGSYTAGAVLPLEVLPLVLA